MMMRIAIAMLGLSLMIHPVAHGQAVTNTLSTEPDHNDSATKFLSSDIRAQKLIAQMVVALGGDLWLNRHDIYSEGHTAAFFHGQPNGAYTPYWDFRRLPDLERIEYTKKRDDVMLFNATTGYEITFKGKKELPKDQIEDYLRRRNHSIEEVVQNWLKAPGVDLVSEGTGMVGRRITDKVTVLSANNDAVTIELDKDSHLPLRRSYRYRNAQFKDWDEDAEEYEDYHTIQGFPTAFSVTRYHNGDMQNQRYITKVIYNETPGSEIFDVDKPLLKRK